MVKIVCDSVDELKSFIDSAGCCSVFDPASGTIDIQTMFKNDNMHIVFNIELSKEEKESPLTPLVKKMKGDIEYYRSLKENLSINIQKTFKLEFIDEKSTLIKYLADIAAENFLIGLG